MPVRQIDPADRSSLRSFIRLERELHRGDRAFVPSIEADEQSFLSGNAALSAGIECALFVVSNGSGGDQRIGRCAAFLNQRYQEEHHEAVGFIGHFAAAPDARDDVLELISTAEEWLGRRGVTRVIAPYSSLGNFGLRSAEYQRVPLFPFRWHPPYYAEYLETAGYRPTYPWWSFRVDFASDRYRETSRRALEETRCVVRPFDKKRWDEEWAVVADLFNRCFRDEWEFYPLTVEEWRGFYDPVKPLFDPRQALFAEIDDEPVGVCIGSPDYNPLFRKVKGKLGPLGQLRFALGARTTRGAGLWLIGTLPERRGMRIGQTLASTLYRRYEELGLDAAEYHLVNDANIGSRSLAESLGGEGRILYHNYDRRLD